MKMDVKSREIRLLTNELLKKSFFKDAKFIMVAASGAMGHGGDVCVIKENGSIYSGNYVYGKLDGEKFIQTFPYVLDEEYDVLKNTGKSTDGKFYYIYMGAGNHLLIAADVWDKFEKAASDCECAEDYYEKWYEVACTICPVKEKYICHYPKGDEPNIFEPNPSNGSKRFILGRDGKNPLVAICMNPSVADDNNSDPTVNRIIKVSKKLGNDGWFVVNLYPKRATHPNDIGEFDRELSDENTHIVRRFLLEKNIKEVWGAWGNQNNIEALEKGKSALLDMLDEISVKVFYFGTLTKSGNPKHPLQRMEKWDYSKKNIMSRVSDEYRKSLIEQVEFYVNSLHIAPPEDYPNTSLVKLEKWIENWDEYDPWGCDPDLK